MPARSSQGFANAQISSGPALTVRQPAFVRIEKRRRAVAPKRLRPEPKQNSKNSWRQIGLSLKEAPYRDELGGQPASFNCVYDHNACSAAFDLLVGRLRPLSSTQNVAVGHHTPETAPH